MWIKICGIRDCETALQVAKSGADAIGLNFYSRSPRSVTIDQAVEISLNLPPEVERVGVFVNHPVSDVASIANKCRLDRVQLHGDETPSDLAELHHLLPHIRLIRAWRMRDNGLADLKIFLDECRLLKISLDACLVDAHVEGSFGGSGKTVCWDTLVREYDCDRWPPLILAGGLTFANVAQAIAATNSWGVDVASGVESSPGIKDPELVRRFVENARLK